MNIKTSFTLRRIRNTKKQIKWSVLTINEETINILKEMNGKFRWRFIKEILKA